MKPSTARTAAAIIAAAGLVLLTAACGGSPSATASGGSSNAGGSARPDSAVAFSGCMRSHAVPNFPDPSNGGGVPKESAQQLGVSSSQLQVALNACQHLLPNSGNIDDNPAALHRWWSQMLHFARCMHSHGVPGWPDPSAYSQDPLRPTFNLHAAGIGFHQGAQPGNVVNSPQIEAKVRQCESVVHLGVSGWYQ